MAVFIGSKIVILQFSHRNSGIRIWNHILGGLLRYKHQMLRCGYQFQSPRWLRTHSAFLTLVQLKTKQMEILFYCSSLFLVKFLNWQTPACATALLLLSALLLLPQGMHSPALVIWNAAEIVQLVYPSLYFCKLILEHHKGSFWMFIQSK